MFITGPWNLADFPDANYGVQVMPSFAGGTHDTIAGPDAWVVMDNGGDRVEAAWKLTQYLTAPEQVLSEALATGHLPTQDVGCRHARVRAVRDLVPRRRRVRDEPRERQEGAAVDRGLPADLLRPRQRRHERRAWARRSRRRRSPTPPNRPTPYSQRADGRTVNRRLQRAVHSEHAAGWAFAGAGDGADRHVRADPDRVVVRALVPEVEPARARPAVRRTRQLPSG